MKNLLILLTASMFISLACASEEVQLFYGARQVFGKTTAKVLIKRIIKKDTIIEEVIDCNLSPRPNEKKVESYRVVFNLHNETFFTLVETLQSAFIGTGEIRNAEGTEWISHSIMPNGWKVISDDKLITTNGKLQLSVKKLVFAEFPNEQGKLTKMTIEMNETFIEINDSKFMKIYNIYSSSATTIDCTIELN